MIFLSLINLFVLIFLLRKDRHATGNNVFSPGSIFLYFSFLPALSNLYFSFAQESFQEIVLNLVHPKFHDQILVNVAISLNIIGNIIMYFGIYYGSRSKNLLFSLLLDKLFLSKYTQNLTRRQILRFGYLVFFSGFLVYLIFLQKMGGLFQVWNELEMRSKNNAGLGYYQTFYMTAIPLGGMILIWHFKKYKKRMLKIFFLSITIIIMGSLGARGPVVIFLLSLLIANHFLFKRIKNIINFKTILLGLTLPIFIVVLLQFRSNSLVYYLDHHEELVTRSIADFESGFVARVGRLERDIVILGYFENHDFWWGKSYQGLLYAPIPRTYFPEKPPNDTGMYLRAIATGDTVIPPTPVSQLHNSSWPEGNWIGYMNFGIFGFILLFWVSGAIFGKLYNYIKKRDFPLLPTIIFSILAVGGPPVLSPPGLITLMTTFFVILMLLFLFVLPMKFKK